MCECPVEKSMRACENIYGPDRAYKCEQALVKAFFKCQKLITHRRGWAYAAYERFGPGDFRWESNWYKIMATICANCFIAKLPVPGKKRWQNVVMFMHEPHPPCCSSSTPLSFTSSSSSLSWSLSFCADSRPLLSFQAYLPRHWIELSLYTCRIFQ